MLPPYTNYPYISQNPNMTYTPQTTGVPYQQYTQDYGTMNQYYPMQNYPMQNPYDTYGGESFSSMPAQTNLAADPPPILSNNPATATTVLFKELTGYPNYGNPSRNADILYTGNQGTWTFESPAFPFAPGNLRGQLRIRAVLDDHANVPVSRYSARITVNGNVVHSGRLPLAHGVPSGGMFTNWSDLTFNITNLRRPTRVTIENTSSANPGDWIGLDWMELRFTPR